MAGAVALLTQRFPNDIPHQIKQWLTAESTLDTIYLRTNCSENLFPVIAATTPNRLVYIGNNLLWPGLWMSMQHNNNMLQSLSNVHNIFSSTWSYGVFHAHASKVTNNFEGFYKVE